MPHTRTLLATMLLTCAAFAIHSAEVNVKPGDQFTPITLEDQHGNAITIDDRTRLVLFTSDMDGGKVVRKVLDDRKNAAELLAAGHAKYISDISEMPSMIRRMMALPAMRKRPYLIMLDSEGSTTANLPRQPNAVTLISLDTLKVTGVEYTTNPDRLSEVLGISEHAEQ